jgi:hypothetical protein
LLSADVAAALHGKSEGDVWTCGVCVFEQYIVELLVVREFPAWDVQKALPISALPNNPAGATGRQDWRLKRRWSGGDISLDQRALRLRWTWPQRGNTRYEAECTAPVRARFLSLRLGALSTQGAPKLRCAIVAEWQVSRQPKTAQFRTLGVSSEGSLEADGSAKVHRPVVMGISIATYKRHL